MSSEKPADALVLPEPADDYEREARKWLKEVYQGDKVRQLSVRSIITGMLLGGVMSVSNLYVGLRIGWTLGVTITSCIVAFAIFKALEIIPYVRRSPFTILENYTMSSAASAAGSMSSAGLVSAIPALFITTGVELEWWKLMAWISAVSVLGVFMAVPLKRQLINVDKLPFPSGLATAETLKSMHTVGREAVAKAWSLFAAAIIGAVVAFLRDEVPKIAARFQRDLTILPDTMPLIPGEAGRSLLSRTSLGFEGSLIMIAAGAIMGIRVGVSLLIGAVIYYGVIGSYLIDNGIIAGQGYGKSGINSWTLWPATAMMVTSGLLAFAFRWRTVLRAFAGLAKIFRARPAHDVLDKVEVPGWWFGFGTLASGAVCVVLGQWWFGIEWYMGVLAVLLTFVLSIVAARATGETDVTPIGAMGKITQLFYGVVAPSNITTNLMTASITAGAASHSADLLTDLKSGYLLGGNARKQTISQLYGVLAGTLICVPVYQALVGDGSKLGSAEMPAPAAQVWAGVAEIMAKGLQELPQGALWAMAVGGAVGIVLTCLEEYLPRRHRKWVPSPTGLGIAGVVPAFNSVSMFLGALAAWMLSKTAPQTDQKYTIPFSSGLIAGESLMGVGIIFYEQGPAMMKMLSDSLGW